MESIKYSACMKVTPILYSLYIGLFLLVNGSLMAQSPLAIQCNDNSTVSLFFPSKVVKIVSPGVNYKFEYDEAANLGTLQGRRGNASNLTVITDNGYIFSFTLNFSEDIEKFNYILSPDHAVGKLNHGLSVGPTDSQDNSKAFGEEVVVDTDTPEQIVDKEKEVQPEFPSEVEVSTVVGENKVNLAELEETEDIDFEAVALMEASDEEQDLYDVDRQEYYRIFCENNYLQKTIFKRSFRQNKRIVLKLNNILVDRDEIYFVLQIENNSKRELVIDGLSFFRKSAVGQLQKIMKPRYTFNLQDKLDPDSINEIVYVFKNFKISSKELIYIALAEKGNNNMVILPLDNKQVNFPSN